MPIGLLLTMCVGWGQPSLASLQEREIEFQGKMHKQFVHRYTPPPRYTPLNLLQGSESMYWNMKLHSLQAKAVQDFYNQLPEPKDSMDAHFPRTSALGGSETYVCTLMVRHDDQGRITELAVTRASKTEVGPLIILRP